MPEAAPALDGGQPDQRPRGLQRRGSQRLGAALAKIFASAPQTSVTWRGGVIGLLAIIGGTALGLSRHPGGVAVDTVWAEDGTIFLSAATHGSPLAPLTTSYAGYYHLVPRLLAALTALFPASAAAIVLATSAAAVTAALAVLVYCASAGHFDSRLSRLLVAAPVVLLPLGQQELLNSIANLHWPALYALFWMLIWSPAGRVGRVVAPVAVVLVAFSDILVLGLLPLAVLRIVLRRDRYSVLLGVLLGAGLAVQISGLLTGSSSRALAPDPVSWAGWYVLRAVPQAILGERLAPDGSADTRHLLLAGVAWLLIAIAALVALRRVSRPHWPLVLIAGLHSVILYALPVFLAGMATPRYAAAPAMLLVLALVAAVQPGAVQPHATQPGATQPGGAGHRLPRRGSLVPIAALTAACLVVWGLSFRVDTPRAHSPRWGAELDKARATCASRLGGDGAGNGVAVVHVPIAPARATPSDPLWLAALPCSYVLR